MFKIVPKDLLKFYKNLVLRRDLQLAYDKLESAAISNPGFNFHFALASVYSGKTEGENIDLDSYVKHKRFNIELLEEYTIKSDDLYDAYEFAANHVLNKQTLSAVYRILARNFKSVTLSGQYRLQKSCIISGLGEISYQAAPPTKISDEMEKLFGDIEVLLLTKLEVDEVLFFASLLHLIFVKIHPWEDGNGRTARLLEKWFIAQKLGSKAWLIKSELHYFTHYKRYISSLNAIGSDYVSLNYNHALEFLIMLPESILEKE